MWEYAIVGLVVAAAAGAIVWSFLRTARGKAGPCAGCRGCQDARTDTSPPRGGPDEADEKTDPSG